MMNIKQKIKDYKEKKSLWNKISDALFLIFIVLLIIPTTRMEVMAAINKIRVLIVQPSVAELEDAPQLSANDYHWQIQEMGDSNTIPLSDLKGKIIFLNFWATWCPPCIAEMPMIQKLYEQYKDDPDIAFVILTNEPQDRTMAFIQKKGFTFPVYTTKYAPPQLLASNSIPATFVITPEGKIVISEIGAADWNGNRIHELFKLLKK